MSGWWWWEHLFHWLIVHPPFKKRSTSQIPFPWLLTIFFFLSPSRESLCVHETINGGERVGRSTYAIPNTVGLGDNPLKFCFLQLHLFLASLFTTSMMSSPHQQQQPEQQQQQQQPNTSTTTTSTPFIDPSSVMVAAAAYSAAGLPPLSHLLLPDQQQQQQQPLQQPPTPQHTPTPTMSSCAFYYPSPPQEPENNKAYSFVPGATQKKRPRRKYHEIERLYPCSYPGCSKSYGTLNHLNAHVAMQKHVSWNEEWKMIHPSIHTIYQPPLCEP